MQTQPTELSEHARYFEAELDYVTANFTNISLRFRRTLRRIAVLSLLALSVNGQNPTQTPAGRVLDKLLFAVEKEWPEVTPMQLVAFTEWFADAFQQFSLSESELNAALLGF